MNKGKVTSIDFISLWVEFVAVRCAIRVTAQVNVADWTTMISSGMGYIGGLLGNN